MEFQRLVIFIAVIYKLLMTLDERNVLISHTKDKNQTLPAVLYVSRLLRILTHSKTIYNLTQITQKDAGDNMKSIQNTSTCTRDDLPVSKKIRREIINPHPVLWGPHNWMSVKETSA